MYIKKKKKNVRYFGSVQRGFRGISVLFGLIVSHIIMCGSCFCTSGSVRVMGKLLLNSNCVTLFVTVEQPKCKRCNFIEILYQK